ncbi:MAG: Npt1/Npt2 family nucleotide transporter, partial [Planctomycetota bacterium]
MTSILEKVFKIRPGERRKVILMFFYQMCVIASLYTVGRTVANTLFLKQISKEYLPYTYIFATVGVVLSTIVYGRYANRLRRDHTIIITTLILAVSALAVRGVLFVESESIIVLGALFVFIEIAAMMVALQFWTFANEIFTSREARRLFGFLAAGGIIGSILFGLMVKMTIGFVGAANMLFIIALLLFICAALVRSVGKISSETLTEVYRKSTVAAPARAPRKNMMSDVFRVLRTGSLLSILGIAGIMSLSINLVDYQWKVAVQENYRGDEAGMGGYFGMFYLYAGVASCIFQFLICTLFIEKRGVLFRLLLLPVSLLFMSFGILFYPFGRMIWPVTGAKGSDILLRFTINATTIQLLYLPVAAEFRARAKAVIVGILKPIFIAGSGFTILALSPFLETKEISYVVIGLIFVWITVVILAKIHYTSALAESIIRNKLDLENSTIPV